MTVDEIIDGFADGQEGDFVVGVIADKITAHLREHEPRAFREWLDEHAAIFVHERIRARLRSQRGTALHRGPGRRFAESVEAGEVGHFAVTYVVDLEATRRRVRDMTGPDHLFVAQQYDGSARRELMLAAFHRVVAKRVGRRRTGDVLSEEQYDALLASVTAAA